MNKISIDECINPFHDTVLFRCFPRVKKEISGMKGINRKKSTEAATGGVLLKKMFLKISPYSATFLKRDCNTGVFL